MSFILKKIVSATTYQNLGEIWLPVSEITKDIMTSSMEILMRAHVRVVTRTGSWIISMLDNDRKFMCIEFG